MRVKLLEEGAITPTKATEFSAGFDLYSVEDKHLCPTQAETISTGIAIEIPFGCVGIIKGRSSLGAKGISVLGGVIDCDYRGEVKVILSSVEYYRIRKTERIAQLLILPLAPMKNHLEVVEELTETERGEKGFGSSNEEEIIHYNEHGLDWDGIAAKPICKAENGKMISIVSSVTCSQCVTILERAGYNVRKPNPNKT